MDIVQMKMEDQTWIDSQDSEFIDGLTVLHEQFVLAVRQNMLMVQLFNEYGGALRNILEPAIATENDIVSNTNSPEESAPAPEPANRAERRAQGKRKTPLDL